MITNMNKEFVPYKETLALKELGFDESCFGWYDYLHSFTEYKINNSKLVELNMVKESCSTPLYQQAFRWFREKYNFHISPTFSTINGYDFIITKYINEGGIEKVLIKMVGYKSSYEEAELACLQILIENVNK